MNLVFGCLGVAKEVNIDADALSKGQSGVLEGTGWSRLGVDIDVLAGVECSASICEVSFGLGLLGLIFSSSSVVTPWCCIKGCFQVPGKILYSVLK